VWPSGYKQRPIANMIRVQHLLGRFSYFILVFLQENQIFGDKILPQLSIH
jgi:hypothetical protein